MKDDMKDPIPGTGAVNVTTGTYSRRLNIAVDALGNKPIVTSNVLPGYQPEHDEIQVNVIIGGWQVQGDWEANAPAPDLEITQIA